VDFFDISRLLVLRTAYFRSDDAVQPCILRLLI